MAAEPLASLPDSATKTGLAGGTIEAGGIAGHVSTYRASKGSKANRLARDRQRALLRAPNQRPLIVAIEIPLSSSCQFRRSTPPNGPTIDPDTTLARRLLQANSSHLQIA